MNHCHQCGEKLQVVTTSTLTNRNHPTMEAAQLDNVFTTNSGECFGKRVDVQLYFAILRYFINLVRCCDCKNPLMLFKICRVMRYFASKYAKLKQPLRLGNFLLKNVKICGKCGKNPKIIIVMISFKPLNKVVLSKNFLFERYPTELDNLFKYAIEGKTTDRKTIINKPKTDSVLSFNRQ